MLSAPPAVVCLAQFPEGFSVHHLYNEHTEVWVLLPIENTASSFARRWNHWVLDWRTDLNAPVGVLSGGQRQALALVMATISNPSLLLLDEHISTLDPNTARSVLELTKMIIERESITAIMVTHNMEIALNYGSRLIMMHKGRIIVDLDHTRKSNLTFNDLIAVFEQASGERFTDDNILLSRTESTD